MRGRPRTPTNLRILQGNPGKRPLPKDEPKPKLGGDPPAWLTVAGRKEWDGLAPMLERLRVLTEADVDALAQLCEAQAELKAGIAEGRFRSELWRCIMAMQARFGLTPADRARIKTVPKEPESVLDEFTKQA